jgi:group I intron endonuclease
MVIYKITNKINSKIYIGITTRPIGLRISSYKSATKSEKKSKHRMVMAMKKYGFENFAFEIIDSAASREELKQKEISYIALLDSTNVDIGYNVSLGGFLPNAESLKKTSAKLTGRPLTKEHARKISQSKIGKKRPASVGIAVGNASRGRPSWNKGLKSIMKSNSGAFAPGKTAPNKGRKKIIIDGKTRYVHPEAG